MEIVSMQKCLLFGSYFCDRFYSQHVCLPQRYAIGLHVGLLPANTKTYQAFCNVLKVSGSLRVSSKTSIILAPLKYLLFFVLPLGKNDLTLQASHLIL